MIAKMLCGFFEACVANSLLQKGLPRCLEEPPIWSQFKFHARLGPGAFSGQKVICGQVPGPREDHLVTGSFQGRL